MWADARALHRAHYERGRGIEPDWNFLDRFEKEMWFFSARAAIEAMREPTEAMIDAGSYYDDTHRGWCVMIDAALAEK